MVIFVCGEDSYRVQQKTVELVAAFEKKFDASGLNVVRLDGEKMKAEDFGDVLRTQPFLSAKRMVVVRGLLGRKLGKAEDDFAKALKAHAEETVVLFADTITPAALAKHGLRKVAGKTAVEYLFPLLTPAELKTWITQEVAHAVGQILPQAAEALVQMVGPDLWRMHQEVAKLTAYAAGRPVAREDVDLLVERHVEENIFALTDALGNGQYGDAAALFAQELEAGSDPFGLFSMLARQVRLLLSTSSYLGEHPSAGSRDVAEALAMHPFVAQKTMSQVRRFRPPQLVAMHGALVTAERRIKTGRSSPSDAIRDFLGSCSI